MTDQQKKTKEEWPTVKDASNGRWRERWTGEFTEFYRVSSTLHTSP